jgi:hypothetical protein
MGQEDEKKIDLSGFVDTYHAVRSNSSNDIMSSRSRVRIEMSSTQGNSYFFTSINAIHNNVVKDNTTIELREAFFKYTGDHINLNVGRQIIIWGVSDGLRVTDIISPFDYSEFLARDYDDIRMPVNAIKIDYVKPLYSFELVYLPIPEFFILPFEPQNPWSFTQQNGSQEVLLLDHKPAFKLNNGEIGGRFNCYLRGIDFSFMMLHTWNKMPQIIYDNSDKDRLLINSFYDRMDMMGLTVSLPIGKFVVRTDGAIYFNELQMNQNTGLLYNCNSYQALLGVDAYLENDWMISMQIYNRNLDVDDQVGVVNNSTFLTANISKQLFRSTTKVCSFAYIDLTNNALFNRASVDYSLSDQIHLCLGYDWFSGKKGMFGLYSDNSEYWIKAVYSF